MNNQDINRTNKTFPGDLRLPHGVFRLPKPEFTITDGFVATIRRRPESAYEKVTGEVTGGAKLALSGNSAKMR